MTAFVFETTPRIEFGSGVLAKLAELVPAHGPVLIVTDVGIVAAGIVDRALAVLKPIDVDVKIFDGVKADPPEAVVMAATQMAVDIKATCIIGLGGGSSMDVAKLTAILAREKQQLSEMYGVGLVNSDRLPLILVPTTAGTGSEVTKISVISTTATEKMGVVSSVLLPDAAIVDPDLTHSLPPLMTAATGMDAMVHAIEAFASASPNNNPLSRHLAVAALRLMLPVLERAVHHPNDAAARHDMMLGAMLAGQAFANSPCAAIHALAYPLGGHFKVPHGLSNTLVLPHVLRFNCETVPDAYTDLIAQVLPEITGDSTAMADGFVAHLGALSRACGIPQDLRDVGVGDGDLAMMARDAMRQTRLLVNNPREVTEADALAIYQAAF